MEASPKGWGWGVCPGTLAMPAPPHASLNAFPRSLWRSREEQAPGLAGGCGQEAQPPSASASPERGQGSTRLDHFIPVLTPEMLAGLGGSLSASWLCLLSTPQPIVDAWLQMSPLTPPSSTNCPSPQVFPQPASPPSLPPVREGFPEHNADGATPLPLQSRSPAAQRTQFLILTS